MITHPGMADDQLQALVDTLRFQDMDAEFYFSMSVTMREFIYRIQSFPELSPTQIQH
eukprot:TRINITY_DN9266_c0_g1_i1.p1 TRINITY_DN9266_c0_g1~~TRINITY_DN9266_c0_g1_i1.p1  ORF type:complete len:57 (-),score=8.34 TRINITY_DN9266_c0_g1_i1:403-573(-)